ncbi:TetR/AcrR family transcriptional regulator [Mycobacterium sp. 21AC1]|uniref:TetR/AcrR family transcriptional regulator n=1 Tax=[Mycobacterium] appelbergii TaxID=2939269 RepID=UPI0029392596|nr:TetR/AcrR family transcriptional regulator [Mycobacterium sp. 21AC1]MDV3124587.1 TetR/AcrR family transcriptional regulator [Mycobacterium sp. 21AC1]
MGSRDATGKERTVLRRRGGTQSSPISKTDVVDAAMRVVARSSLERLTVREVAAECGVTPPAIHYHLRGGDDLTDRVVEAVAAQIDVRLDPRTSWIDQYLGLVSAMDRAFLAYPGTGLHALTSTGPSAAATRLTDTALGILRQAGCTEDAAVQTFTATYLMFVGWLATRSRAEGNTMHPALAAAGATGLGRDGGRPLEEAMRRILMTAQGGTT